MSQKDSFIRMNWSDEDSTLSFLSRTTSRIHGQLVRRIFNDSQQEFVRTQYRVLKDDNIDSLSQEDNDRVKKVFQLKNESEVDGFTRVVDKRVDKRVLKKNDKPENNPRDKTKYGRPKKIEESGEKLKENAKQMIRGKKSAQV
jgi:hypothetical protein